MEIQYIPVKKLIPYRHNNRVHTDQQVERIARSIQEFGFTQPLVVTKDEEVIAGHGRLLAAKHLKMESVPCVYVFDLSEEQVRALRILDNKLQNDSTWDYDAIELELDWLESKDFDLPGWGLDELRLEGPELEDVQEDETPEPPDEKDCYIKLGDEIELGKHRVVCGDCTEVDVAAPNSLDLLLTDPPYGVDYVGKTKDALVIKNDSGSEEETIALFKAALDCSLRLLKMGGSVYISVPPGPIHWEFANALKERGVIRQTLVWLKDSMVLGHSDYHYEHEPILYGWKPGASHYFTSDRCKKSVLKFDRPKRSSEHPTMKPVALWAELISNSTKKSEVVLDCFLGSGTTLIACEQLGRKCYGTEIEPKYCQVIIERYKKYCEDNNKPFECTINGEPFEVPEAA